MIPVLEQSNNFFYRGKGGDGGISGTFGYSSQTINTAVASMSYVTGAHALKVGFSDTWANTVSTTDSNSSSMMFRFNNGVPNLVTLSRRADTRRVAGEGRAASTCRIAGPSIAGPSMPAFATTASVEGIRSSIEARASPADARLHLPGRHQHEHARHHAAARRVLRSVRQRKTALKASVGKYMLTLFTIGNPAGVSTTTTRNWNDLLYPVGDPRRGNFNPDCDQLNPAANGECSAYSANSER